MIEDKEINNLKGRKCRGKGRRTFKVVRNVFFLRKKIGEPILEEMIQNNIK